jgi:CheY-like chemotaxis protein
MTRETRTGAKGPVLVVDDEPNILDFIRLALEDEGYHVLTAPNGAAALDVLRTEQPRLILLDLRMPGMDGATFVQNYRARAADAGEPVPESGRRGAPIVVLTASRVPVEEAEALGADGMLRKPFEVEALLEAVERYVGCAS